MSGLADTCITGAAIMQLALEMGTGLLLGPLQCPHEPYYCKEAVILMKMFLQAIRHLHMQKKITAIILASLSIINCWHCFALLFHSFR